MLLRPILLIPVYLLLPCLTILLTKITAAQNEVALSYYTVRGLCSPAVVFAPTIELLAISVSSIVIKSTSYNYMVTKNSPKRTLTL